MLLTGHKEGVTQVHFDGWNVYSVARKEDQIWQWDLRIGQVCKSYGPRKSTTNQRIYFTPLESQLYTGDQDGNLLIFDTTKEGDNNVVSPVNVIPISNMIISSTTISSHHPNVIACTMGERNYYTDDLDSEDEDDSKDNNSTPPDSELRLLKII